ncbi:hypothetical protein MWU54_07200 [Marivita sp. S6314]|uniref:hypothetical protein n=1 Tax=Marivita sp. S6314 TaxID=2926406 RepID=UPI001FF48CCD|nr:hypothetical protein [Marivita sp. S6314]MCK0149802.1 hypothetical protein [Marivita sp. S6314]
MLIARTLTQLQVKPASPERAKEMGQLGYMQWLGGLPAGACYQTEAACAYIAAMPFKETDPAVEVFCGLLRASLKTPLQPLDLALPKPKRRGGAKERRLSL